jgi:hypothetical protein
MTQEQRYRLADQYIAQYGVTAEVDEFKALREEFLKANPEAASLKDYQRSVGKMASEPGGVTAWRTAFARDAENGAFAAAMAKKEGQLRKDGKTDVCCQGTRPWALGADAYNAANYYRKSIYDEALTPNRPDYGFATSGSTGGGGGTSSGPKDPMTQLADHLKGYQDKMDLAVKQLNAAGYAVTAADVMNASPLYATAFALRCPHGPRHHALSPVVGRSTVGPPRAVCRLPRNPRPCCIMTSSLA